MVTYSRIQTLPVEFNGPAFSGPITVTATGGIITTNQTAMRLYSGPYTVQINGIVGVNNAGFAGTAVALELYPVLHPGDSDIVIGATGRVTVSKGASMVWFGQYNLTNNGTVNGGMILADFKTTDTSTIINNGVMSKSADETKFFSGGAGAETFINNGTISGDLDFYSGSDSFTNSKTLIGNIFLGSGGATPGANQLLNSATGLIRGDIIGGDASNTITNQGRIEGIVRTDGKGFVNNSGVVTVFVEGGFGNDTILNSGTINSGLFDRGGINSYSNSGVIKNVVMFSNDTDTLGNTGQIQGDIFFNDGTNTLTNYSPGLITGGVFSGSGADKITNQGRINGNVRTGDGSVNILNSGIISGFIDAGGTGGGVITNTGTVGAIQGGAGGNIISNSGTVNGGIGTGNGADTITNSGVVLGEIFMGGGTNRFTGGTYGETVRDQNGTDTYFLNGGNDHFLADTGGGGLDNIDGGTQVSSSALGDHYDASNASFGISINIDSVAHTDPIFTYYTLAANKAISIDTGNDNVFNFESVSTGGANDVIFGSGVANTVNSGAGNDRIYTFAGNDTINTGDGSDTVIGGLGADVIRPQGVISDTVRDFIRYHALNESTVALAGRDTVIGFDDSNATRTLNDVFDFRGLTTVTGKHFNTVGNGIDDAFDGIAGAVRVMTTAAGWTVEMDSDGNATADMAINVADAGHLITWDSFNFLF